MAHAAGLAPTAPAGTEETLSPAELLKSQIDELLADRTLVEASVGVHIVDLRDGQILYTRNADVPLNPASNMKLTTTAVALALLGPEHTFATRLYHGKDALRGATIQGDLYLRGTGDPSFITEDIYAMASDLAARGIQEVTGGIVVDNTAFDRDELPPGFDQKDELAPYRAPSGATSANFNTFVVRVQPGATVGATAIAIVNPPVPGITLINDVQTSRGRRNRQWADVEYEPGITVHLRGKIGIDANGGSYRYAVADPSRYAGEVMALVLGQRGIKVRRKTITVGPTPTDARVVVTHNSAALSVLIRSVNKLSNNFMAEQLLKVLDDGPGPATFQGGLGRLREGLVELGVDLDGAVLGNGSGLYDNNRLSPHQITTLLIAMSRDFRYASDFVGSLAVFGVDGTTRRRLHEGQARSWGRVKTGTLNDVSALSGYVGAPDREPIVFSMLFNELPSGPARGRRIQDSVAEVIAQYAVQTSGRVPDPSALPSPPPVEEQDP